MRPVSSKRPARPLDVEGLLAYAARLLSGRALTVSEMRERLKRRAAVAGDADQVIARLRESGYLSDPKLAQTVASWKRENEGVGQGRVVRDLLARRVAEKIWARCWPKRSTSPRRIASCAWRGSAPATRFAC